MLKFCNDIAWRFSSYHHFTIARLTVKRKSVK